MSHLRARDIEDLHAIADEVHEVFSERGHKVGVALDLDPAFAASGRVESALLRSLVADGVSRGASRIGHDFRRVRGAVQVTIPTSTHLCILRLRRAEQRKDGTYNIPTNNAASWGTLDDETLDMLEHWVLGFTVAETGTLESLFAAEVLGVEGGTPGRLTLGDPIALGTAGGTPPSRGFQPRDESLPGFGDEDDELGFGRNAG